MHSDRSSATTIVKVLTTDKQDWNKTENLASWFPDHYHVHAHVSAFAYIIFSNKLKMKQLTGKEVCQYLFSSWIWVMDFYLEFVSVHFQFQGYQDENI